MKRSMRHLQRPQVRRLCRTLWCAAWLALSVLLLMPVEVATPAGSDLVAHVLLFGAMAFSAVSFCHDPRRLALLSVLTLAAAILLECAQGLVPWRSFEIQDMVADGVGVLAGYGAALLALRLLIRPPEPALRAPGVGAWRTDADL